MQRFFWIFWIKIFSRSYARSESMMITTLIISMRMMQSYSIAKAVHAEKLAFLSDIEGVYRDYEDKSSLITALTVDQANELIESGAISGGMIPKLQNCVGAIENGVSRVHILDGRIPHCLLLEIFTKKGIGTAILRNGEED